MFNSITWGQYFFMIFMLLIIYYLIIGFRFFKWEILNVFGISKVEKDLFSTESIGDLQTYFSTENPEDYLPKTTMEIDISLIIQTFIDEIKAFLKETDLTITSKGEMINSIKVIFSKYPLLKDSECRKGLEIFLVNEINQQYPKSLVLKDLSKIWI